MTICDGCGTLALDVNRITQLTVKDVDHNGEHVYKAFLVEVQDFCGPCKHRYKEMIQAAHKAALKELKESAKCKAKIAKHGSPS